MGLGGAYVLRDGPLLLNPLLLLLLGPLDREPLDDLPPPLGIFG